MSDYLEFREDAPVGRRGPAPSSGFTFRGYEVVLRARTPAIRVERGARERAIADGRGYVSIHRLVASEARGRWVTRSEGVRPIDGDPWNWTPSNLQVVRQGAGLPLARRAQRRRRPT